jgi:hypothetical protein
VVKNKGDKTGLQLSYVTLKEKGEEEMAIGNNWAMNNYDQQGE